MRETTKHLLGISKNMNNTRSHSHVKLTRILMISDGIGGCSLHYECYELFFLGQIIYFA